MLEEPVAGIRKAAILTVLLGDEASAGVFRYLQEDEVQEISREISRLGKIEPELADNVLDEFHRMTTAQTLVARGGAEFAKRLLVKAFGGDEVVWPKAFIADGLAAFERAAKDTAGQFCVGDSPSIADCCLVPQLASARRFGVDVAKHSLLLAIEERCLALPAFANAAPDRQPDAVK